VKKSSGIGRFCRPVLLGLYIALLGLLASSQSSAVTVGEAALAKMANRQTLLEEGDKK